MFSKLTVRDARPRGQNVLVRVDYNVPLKDGVITDDLRIRASLPTIEYLKKKGARRIILCSHLGRPEGKKVPELSLRPIAERLKALLGEDAKVNFVGDVSGPDVDEAVEKTPVGGILLLENLRFFPGEEANSAEFAREIAESTHADLFVQDGFAVIHRAHASTDAITKEIPSVAGLLLEKEVSELTKVAENPAHPFVMILGGAKVDDKQPLIEKIVPKAEKVLVGGKIAADGYAAPADLTDKVIVAGDFATDGEGAKLDIAEAEVDKFIEIIKTAKTILWNGTLGKVEDPEFAKSSEKIAFALAESTKNGATTVICGGDTTGFIENLQAKNPDLQYSLVSTGGGASLELLSGLSLPGLENLDE